MTALRAALRSARHGLRARRRRAITTGIGVALAAAMLSAAVVISYGLGTGFARASTASGLPDIIARFNQEPTSTIVARIDALPDIARYSLRLEFRSVGVGFQDRRRDGVIAEVLSTPGKDQGYAIVDGRNLSDRSSGILVEKGFAQAWGMKLGQTLYVQELGPQRIVGFAEGPDDVGYPLGAPRIYISLPAVEARFGAQRDPHVNLAEIWLRNPRYVNEVLAQARSTAYGLQDVQFATRAGLKILLGQAAGIVIDLLVALSIIALVTAGVLLAASARAEVQRRLGAIGVRRAVGETRAQVALAQGLEGLLVALPFGTLGIVVGVLVTGAPANRLLTLLNEPPPGSALIVPVLLAWLAAVLVPSLGAAWPAWRAAGGPVIGLLRGGDVGNRRSSLRFGGPGLGALGARLVAARRARLIATAVTLGLSTAFVLLMLALASELSSLETDPGALGKRYQLTAQLPASSVPRVSKIHGVQAVAPRYSLNAADSFELGETISLIAYPGDHTIFEAPPLTEGHRYRGNDQAEVGAGLADALGLIPGSTLALALPNGRELRLKVSGVVSSLANEGHVAYIPAAALLRDDPTAPESLAVLVSPSGNVSGVEAQLARLGGEPATASAATARGVPLVKVLRTILISVAVVDGLVCLYGLIQACALTVFERRRTIAVLRACGAGGGAIARILLGAVLVLIVPAAVIGIVLERWVFGPALSRLAENYASLPLAARAPEIIAVVVGLSLAAAVAVLWVTREATSESVVEGLSG